MSLFPNSEVPSSPVGATSPGIGITTHGGRSRGPERRSGHPPAARPRGPGQAGDSLFGKQTSGGEEGRGARVGFRPPPAATGRTRPGRPRPGAGSTREADGGGRGSPFWPLSAAYQESERKAHRQKSSSVRKVPLRSLISGARRAPAGPRPHGPGDRGPGAGAGRRRGPRPRGGEGWGPGAGRGCGRAGPGTGPGSALTDPPGRGVRAASARRLGRAGPGWAGLGGESRGPAWI